MLKWIILRSGALFDTYIEVRMPKLVTEVRMPKLVI
jgi:hypothetical protein